jgi:hypothetical protein
LKDICVTAVTGLVVVDGVVQHVSQDEQGVGDGADNLTGRRQPVPDRVIAPVRRVYRTGIVIVLIALAMGSLFAVAYSLMLARPAPRHVPLAVVGSPAVTAPVLHALQADTRAGFQPRAYTSLRTAESAVANQRALAVLDGAGHPATLYVCSACGASVSNVIVRVVRDIASSMPVRIIDLRPLPVSDPQGLTTFYLAISATVMGFATMFQVRANVHGIRLCEWLILVTGLALGTGGVLAVIADPIIGALHGPFAKIWILLSLQCAIAALFGSLMLVLIGRWAVVPTWLLFVVLGNTSSGGAVSAPLLPTPYAVIGRFLPTGATVSALHTAIYFGGHQHWQPRYSRAG